ncbi:MAG: DUF1851 domain-containing protein, partial [Steroidobacter sp.]
MRVEDYLIDQYGKDWHTLLNRWTPPLPNDFTLWLVNRLGELFIVTGDESVHLLEFGTGSLHTLASSREQFAQLLDSGNNAESWLRISLIDGCRRAGKYLQPDECYGFKVPPILQGKYEVDNLEPVRLDKHYSLIAHL